MFRLSPSYERYPCQDTQNEYQDSTFQENRRVNASIGIHVHIFGIYHTRIATIRDQATATGRPRPRPS